MTSWRRGTQVLWRRSGDRVLVLPADAEEIVVLEGTAAVIWDELGRPSGELRLLERLAVRFAEDVTTIEADVRPFLYRLRERGVLDSGASGP